MTRISGRARTVLGLSVAAAAACVVGVLVILPIVTGGVALNVLSGSMEPTYPVGSVVLVRPVAADAVEVGDVITYVTPYSATPTTHRVAEIATGQRGERTFTTKGDANRGVDVDPVPASDVRGVAWFHVPYLGAVRSFLATPAGIGAILLAVVAIGSFDRATSRWRGRRGRETDESEINGTDRSATRVIDPQLEEGFPEAPPRPQPVPAPVVTGLDGVPPQALLVVRVHCSFLSRSEVLALVATFHGRTVAVGRDEVVATFSGSSEELDGIEALLLPSYVTSLRRSDEVPTSSDPVPVRSETLHLGSASPELDGPVAVVT